MKRNKHVLINLNEDQYNALLFIANKQRRKASDAAYLLIIDAINEVLPQLAKISSSGFNEIKSLNDINKL